MLIIDQLTVKYNSEKLINLVEKERGIFYGVVLTDKNRNKALEELDALLLSILDKAFKGEL